MSKSTIMQMTGRAGRPGFDSHGVAVVMTSYEDKDYFTSLRLDVIESCLPEILTEAICAEVTQGVIQSVKDCTVWLKQTFFFLRVKKNPQRYGFHAHDRPNLLEKSLENMCVKSLEDLKAAEIIEMERNGKNFDKESFVSPKPSAQIMTRHMIKLKTMSSIMDISPCGTIYDIVTVICRAEELAKPVIRSEKSL